MGWGWGGAGGWTEGDRWMEIGGRWVVIGGRWVDIGGRWV